MPDSAGRRLLLLGWAGADWSSIQPLLDAGHMPHLESLVTRGASGKLLALPPVLPPSLWSSIATGRWADEHGILAWYQPGPGASGVVPLRSADLQCPPLWQIVEAAGCRAATVGWPLTHPATPGGGVIVSDAFAEARGNGFDAWPLRPGSVWPPELAPALAELRLHPTEVSAEQVLPFVPQAARIDQETDERLPMLVASLARAASVHGAGTWLAERGDWDLLAVHFDFIERLSAAFMRYSVPRMPQVSQADFEIYGGVVDGAYRFMDMMLGRYLELVGPQTQVMLVSDHGFLTGRLRPAPTALGLADPVARGYRRLGILVAAGAGIQRDELVFGASVLDIAPTVLHLLGLAVPQDLQGQVLSRMLDGAAEPACAEPTGRSKPAAPGAVDADWAIGRLVELVALGYLPAIPDDPEAAAEQAAIARLDHLAQVKSARGLHGQALAVLEELRLLSPERWPTRLALAQCHYAMGDLPSCRATLDDLVESGLRGPLLDYLLGQLCLKEGDAAQARRHLQRAAEAGEVGADLHERIGAVHLLARDWDAAETAFRQALDLDPDHAAGHHGLGLALAGRGQHEQAIGPLMQSIGLLYYRPDAHFHLAVALAAAGRPAQACDALLNALKIKPDFAEAQAALQRIQAAMARQAIEETRARMAQAGVPPG